MADAGGGDAGGGGGGQDGRCGGHGQDVAGLAEAIRKLAADAGLRKSMG
jgi:hypothetical protein